MNGVVEIFLNGIAPASIGVLRSHAGGIPIGEAGIDVETLGIKIENFQKWFFVDGFSEGDGVISAAIACEINIPDIQASCIVSEQVGVE